MLAADRHGGRPQLQPMRIHGDTGAPRSLRCACSKGILEPDVPFALRLQGILISECHMLLLRISAVTACVRHVRMH